MLLLIAAGTLAKRGQLHLSLVLLAAVAGSLAADGFWFWLGRRWGSRVIRAVCSLTWDPQRSRERSDRIFARWGLRLLLIAKFVPGLDGVSPPLAGAEGASIKGLRRMTRPARCYGARGIRCWALYLRTNSMASSASSHALERCWRSWWACRCYCMLRCERSISGG
jgi:hypothetical protein